MNPLCPNCSNEMSKMKASRNTFNCVPCREIIRFFDVPSRTAYAAAGRSIPPLAPSLAAANPAAAAAPRQGAGRLPSRFATN
jgi:hypothetical protein